MVDVVKNNMFDTFNKFSQSDNRHTDSGTKLNELKRFTSARNVRRVLTKDVETKAQEDNIYEIKENAPHYIAARRRPVMGLSCLACIPNRKSLVNKTTDRLALKNILHYTPQKSNYGFLQYLFPHLSQVYELKKYEYEQVAGKVFKDGRIKEAIEKTALHQFKDSQNEGDVFYQELLKNNEKRAKKILYDMRSTISNFLLKFTSWVLYKLLPCFISSVVVHPGQIEMLKKTGSSNLPLIFLPLHKSHLDYILMSFILVNNNFKSPLVASGDNLRIPFFGSLLRGLGAFYIKRRVDPVMGRKDHVYKAILHTYMEECLRAGHNIEFYLEGGRTRTGKPCMPKYGVLSVIVEAFMDGTIEDALLVPVSISYEKLVDGNFVREQLGQPKQMETFGNAIKAIWHVLNSNYGMMRVDFNQPFSLKELIKTFDINGKTQNNIQAVRKLKSNPSTTSLYGTDVVSEEHKSVVENISKHVIYDCAQSMAVMSTNAVAFLLLNKFRKGVSIETLVVAFDELKADLLSIDRDLGFTGDSLDVINYAIDLLGPGLIRKELTETNDTIIRPVAMLPNVIELMYYNNGLVTIYAMQAVVATALNFLNVNSGFVPQGDLMLECVSICNILQNEFIFSKPCQNLESVILECIDDLILRKGIFIIRNENTTTTSRYKHVSRNLDFDSDEEYCLAPQYEINSNALEYTHFLKNIIMPLIEAYSISALCLKKLIGKQLLENDFIAETLDEMKLQLLSGSLTCEESVSVDAVKNALKVFQKWDVVECYNEKKLKLLYLKQTHDNDESVNSIYNKINKFRIRYRNDRLE